MIVEFTCDRCGEEQDQELKESGAFGLAYCWSCGESYVYLIEYKSNLTLEQKQFWDRWSRCKEEWKKIHGNQQSSSEREYKNFYFEFCKQEKINQ